MAHEYLFVNEIFGPTVQGEGPSIGQPATFLRVAGCNLRCSWCDTAYTWDWSRYDKAAETHKLNLFEVERQLVAHRAPGSPALVVVSGGEPMLQQEALIDLFDLVDDPWRIEVETAGTIRPLPAWADKVSLFVVSPKLRHSGNDPLKSYKPMALESLNATGRVAWKFVCQVPADVTEVARIVDDLELTGPVYVMPEGIRSETINDRARYLAPAVIEHGFRLTPRLHIDLWGTARGH